MSVLVSRNGRNAVYRVDRRWPDGKRFLRLMPTKPVAEEVDAKIVISIANGSWQEYRKQLARGLAAKRMTLAEAFERYLELHCKVKNRAWQRKRDTMRAIIPCRIDERSATLGEKALEDISVEDIDGFILKRKAAQITDATINRDLAHLQHMMSWCLKRKYLRMNIMNEVDKLDEEIRLRRRATENEKDRFIAAAEPRIRPLFRFIRATGVRLGEAMRLERHQVLRQERLAIISHFTKSKRWRVVPLPDEALAAIDEMPVHPTCPYVFWNLRSGRRWTWPRKLINKARAEADMPWFQLKDFRREYGITLAELGSELHVIQACLGHSSVKTTEDYYAQFSRAWAARKALAVLQGEKATTGMAPLERPWELDEKISNIVETRPNEVGDFGKKMERSALKRKSV